MPTMVATVPTSTSSPPLPASGVVGEVGVWRLGGGDGCGGGCGEVGEGGEGGSSGEGGETYGGGGGRGEGGGGSMT